MLLCVIYMYPAADSDCWRSTKLQVSHRCWKVMKFEFSLFRTWKVLKLDIGSKKVIKKFQFWYCNPEKPRYWIHKLQHSRSPLYGYWSKPIVWLVTMQMILYSECSDLIQQGSMSETSCLLRVDKFDDRLANNPPYTKSSIRWTSHSWKRFLSKQEVESYNLKEDTFSARRIIGD